MTVTSGTSENSIHRKDVIGKGGKKGSGPTIQWREYFGRSREDQPLTGREVLDVVVISGIT